MKFLAKVQQGIVMKAICMGVLVDKRKNNKLALREIAILHLLRHPFIINIMGAYANVLQMFVVMEYFSSDSLFDVLFDKKVKKSQIILRDIKPNNILVNREINAKLYDLGLASTKSIDRSLQSTQKGNIRGTYLFLAPEILLNNNDATTNSDICSFACTLVELFSEESVWNIKDFNDGYLCAFLKQCFNYTPNMRPSFDDLINVFEKIII
ncbi:hypothetical protein TSAR_001394 [Trichomalopsis sarcophagae]|uniref:Protein kinase domain-containing protein n=1 Tax=Trichomalopsis sarcophagae TaxID=543379 RepID=A0A232EPY7_9HYME|nr:hypothetical protein TSAR_001394 [Trichomalopsis sarcophagae]